MLMEGFVEGVWRGVCGGFCRGGVVCGMECHGGFCRGVRAPRTGAPTFCERWFAGGVRYILRTMVCRRGPLHFAVAEGGGGETEAGFEAAIEIGHVREAYLISHVGDSLIGFGKQE